jgi:hypothetical protein
LTLSPNPVAAGDTVTATVTVNVIPPGDVQPFGSLRFTIDGMPLDDPTPLNGETALVATLIPSVPGTYTVGISYSGDADTNSSSAAVDETVATPMPPAAPVAAPPAVPPLNKPSVAPTLAASSLREMASTLTTALARRGFAALTTTVETLTAPVSGILQQRVYSPGAPRSATTAASRATKPLLIASARHTFTAAGRGAVRLKLTSAGRKTTRHANSLKIAIVTRFSPSTGTAVVVVKRLTVKAKGKRSARTRVATRGDWRFVMIRARHRRG